MSDSCSEGYALDRKALLKEKNKIENRLALLEQGEADWALDFLRDKSFNFSDEDANRFVLFVKANEAVLGQLIHLLEGGYHRTEKPKNY